MPMPDESKTTKVDYIRKIQQLSDGQVFYFTGTLVFKDGLLVDARADGPQMQLHPIKDANPEAGAAQP
jgi:hypothetical protein